MRHRSLEEPPPHRPSAHGIQPLPAGSRSPCPDQAHARLLPTPGRSENPKFRVLEAGAVFGIAAAAWGRMLEASKDTDPQPLRVLWRWRWDLPIKPLPDLHRSCCIWVCRGRAGPGWPLVRAFPALPEPHSPGVAGGKGGRGLIITSPSSELQRARKTQSKARPSFGERNWGGAASKDTSHLPAVPGTFCVCERAQPAQVTKKAVPDWGKSLRVPALLPHLPPSRLEKPV